MVVKHKNISETRKHRLVEYKKNTCEKVKASKKIKDCCKHLKGDLLSSASIRNSFPSNKRGN